MRHVCLKGLREGAGSREEGLRGRRNMKCVSLG